ncbi:hypothetical protein KR044_011303, partial [Drosophila immigrans]
MWQQAGAISLTLILQLAVICGRCTAVPLVTTTEMPELEPKEQRIDCKLTFDATMDSLEQQQRLEANGCNVTNKPTDVEQEQEQELDMEQELRHSRPGGGSQQPLYELQLVVWPAGVDGSDDDNDDDGSSTTPRTTTTTTTTTTITPSSSSAAPLYEDQLVVFPQMDFEEENFDYFFDEAAATSTSSSNPSTTRRPNAITPSKPVYVLENFSKKHPNGTAEHKLVLSNGLVNYMKHYAKHVDDKVINVQEGYSSVPVAGLTPLIQTLHYIADEHGYNIHK